MQTYKVANITVGLAPKYEPNLSQVKPYLSQEETKRIIDINISESDIALVRKSHPEMSSGDAEYLIMGNVFYLTLIKFGGMMLHSSAVMKDGQAFLFSAPSGTGKSTHTSLWLKEFPDAKIINDDKPALKIEDGKVFVFGTPWSGKTNLNINTKCKLKGICFLSRGEKNEIERIDPGEAISLMLEETVRPSHPKATELLLETMDKIITTVPIFKMKCNMDPSAAHVSYEFMSKGE